MSGCKGGKGCSKTGRKHTPITSGKQAGLFGGAYGAKKAGKKKPSYVPTSLWNQPMSILKGHLEEWGTKGTKSKRKGNKRGKGK